MAQYDGAIRIATSITTKDAEESLASLSWQIKKSAKYMDELRSKMDTLKDQKIPTKDYKDLQEKLATAEKELKKLVSQDSKLSDVGEKIKSLSQSSAEYASKMKEVAEQKIPTQEYENAQRQVDALEKKLFSLYDRQDRFLSTGGEKDSSAYKRMVYDAEQLDIKLRQAETDMKSLVDAGKAFTLGTDTEQYKNLSAKYEQVNSELEKQKGIHSEIAKKQADAVQKVLEIKSKMQQLAAEGKDFTLGKDTAQYKAYEKQLLYEEEAIKKAAKHYKTLLKTSEGYKKLKETAKSAFSSIGRVLKKANSGINAFGRKSREIAQKHISLFRKETDKAKNSVSGFAGRLKSLALSLLIFNQISKAFRSVSSAISTGFKNLYDDNEQFRSSIDDLRASVLTLQNAFAAAFRPIADMAIPYIQKLVDWLTAAVNLAGQFFAALTGRKTYTRAIKQTAKASEEAAEAAEEETDAMQKQLSPLDKLNNLTSENNKEKDKGKDKDGVGTGIMFEEVPIESGILDIVDRFKVVMSKIFAPLKKAWNREGKFVMDSWKYALNEVWKLIKDIGRDFLTVWQQEKTIRIFENLLHIIGDIGLTVGHLARNFREAWNENETGLHILENIRDIIGVIVHNFRLAADETVKWADKLNFKPLLEAFERFTESLIPLADALSGVLSDFYTQVLLPLGKWTIEKGLPELLDVFTAFNEKVDWDALRTRLSEFWEHLEPFAETVGEGLIIFIERVSDALADFINSEAFGNFLTMIEKFMDSVTPEDVADALTGIAEALIALKLALLGFSAISAVAGAFTTIKTFLGFIAGFGGLVSQAAGLVASGVSGIVAALGGILPALSLVAAAVIGWKIGEWINENLLGVDTPSFFEMMNGIKSSFADGSWKEALHLWGEDIKSAFKDIWKTTEIGWNGMWDAVKRGWNQTAKWIEGAVEAIKRTVESLKGSFNFWTGAAGGKLFGGGRSSSARTYSMSTPIPYAVHPAIAKLSNIEIPQLAKGAVLPANREFLALVGDQKHGTNVEAPLDTIKQALREEAISLGLIGKNETPEINLNLTVECAGYQLLNIIQKLDSEYFKQTGRHALV